MNTLIDTHCHLHDPEFYEPELAEECLRSAQEQGVRELICIGTTVQDSKRAAEFAKAHAGAYWTFGIHPEYADSFPIADLADNFRECVRDDNSKLVAIGEVGLDYHYCPESREKQLKLFEQTLELARKYELPVSLHIREAFPDAFGVLDNFPGVQGVAHSFTGSKKQLNEVLKRGLYVGVNGLATYSTLPMPPLERILLETDAPFLTPAPNRGTMNKPEYVTLVAQYLAQVLGVTQDVIAEHTTENARRLFHIQDP